MARACVCLGVPSELKESTYKSKKGARKGEDITQLSFLLTNPVTSMVGSVPFQTSDPTVMETIKRAEAAEEAVYCACQPYAVRYEVDGENRDWVKMVVKSVLGAQDRL